MYIVETGRFIPINIIYQDKYHKNEEVELDHNKKSEHVHETFFKKTY